MKKIMVGLAIFLCSGSMAMAQSFDSDRGGDLRPPFPHVVGIEKYKAELNLTPAQLKSIETINASYKEKYKAHGNKMKPLITQLREEEKKEVTDFAKIELLLNQQSPELVKLQLDRIHHRKEIQAVLTPDQKAKWTEKLKKLKKAHMEKKDAPHSADNPEEKSETTDGK